LRRRGGKVPDESTTPDSFKPLRRTVEAYRRGDLDEHMSSYAPDAVLDMSARGLGIFEGRAAIRGFWEAIRGFWEAIRGFWEDYYRSFDDLKFELEQALDLGSGVMFAVVRQDARPARSGGSVWEEGKLVRGSSYGDVDEARAAGERLAQERADG
jgi:ketosteroid isomerase-like protein